MTFYICRHKCKKIYNKDNIRINEEYCRNCTKNTKFYENGCTNCCVDYIIINEGREVNEKKK